MLISVWRYSHLTLAISSFLFLLTLSFSGIILSFDPIAEELNTYHIPKASEQSINQTLAVLKNNYEEIIELEVTDNYLVKVAGIDNMGNSDDVYIHPITGKPIAKLSEQKEIFKWATSLHRSLFLKSTGRIIVGFTSFLLFLICISGVVLIIKRQGSLKAFLAKVIKDNFYEYYHVIFGRILLIPILIISFTGVYLSLKKFSLLPKQQEKHQVDYNSISQNTTLQDIDFFNKTLLKEVKKIEFPFSEDVEDYYVVKLKDQEVYVHQYTGDILSTLNISTWKQFYSLSFVLHTGKGNILWSIVLLASSISILFFIYSGFTITWQRIQKKGKKIKNQISKDQATHIILVGSETGSTFTFATSFYNALIHANKKAYICTLNDYTSFKHIEHLIVITATYGDGEPPKNAEKFLNKFTQNPISHQIYYSVVGFGSTIYPDFCKYALDLNTFLANYSHLTSKLITYKIDQQSFNAFQQWATDWSKAYNTPVELEEIKQKTKKYKVVNKTHLDANDTFMLTLKPMRKSSITSGDLIGIKAKENTAQRLYSIAIIDKKIVLSVKKHAHGLCSNYLFSLKKDQIIPANLITNKSFYLPKNSRALLIANGTGIAPFLGMIDENKQKQPIELFTGFKNADSAAMYQPMLEKAIENGTLKKVHYAYSRTHKQYVQDLLLQNKDVVLKTIESKGVIMICGSVKMRDCVFNVLDKITKEHKQLPISYYNQAGLIKTDCY